MNTELYSYSRYAIMRCVLNLITACTYLSSNNLLTCIVKEFHVYSNTPMPWQLIAIIIVSPLILYLANWLRFIGFNTVKTAFLSS